MINEALKQLRKFYGYTQVDLARKLDISRSFLSEIESGEKNPTLKLVGSYAEIFDLPPSSILLFAENINNENYKDKIKVFARSKLLELLRWTNE